MKLIHQEVGVGVWAWREEKDWEQLLEEPAGSQQGMENWVMKQSQGSRGGLQGLACWGAEACSSTASLSALHGPRGRGEARCWLLWHWSPARWEWQNARRTRGFEPYVSLELKMISKGTCRMRKWMKWEIKSRWTRTGERWKCGQIVVNEGYIRGTSNGVILNT